MTFVKADYSGVRAAAAIPGGFLLIVGATFGYAAGWNPYATDYTRYLPADDVEGAHRRCRPASASSSPAWSSSWPARPRRPS